MSSMKQPLVDIKSMTISFANIVAPTIDETDFSIFHSEIVALVGESGSGKSLLGTTLAGILTPAAKFNAERFDFAAIDLTDRKARAWTDLRGREIGIIFQNPRAALNPVRKIGHQIADVLAEHKGLRGEALKKAVIASLNAVRIPDPERRFSAYPGELSGGMCQRVMIAIALAGDPALLIADEPTTGLDTTTQAAILDLIVAETRARKMACLLITHDLALARQYAQRVLVMHAGQVVESGSTEDLFARTRHPYTAALLRATPADVDTVDELQGIAGAFPDLRRAVPACRFANRCERAVDACQSDRPPLTGEHLHKFACWRPVS